jgi:hypothetical protein
MKNRLIKTGFLILAMIAGVSCDNETPVIPTTGLSLSATELLLNVGVKDTLTVNASPVNATNVQIHWISSDTTVAKVNSIGIVSGIAPGRATITAATEDHKYSVTCAVKITKWTSFTINPFPPYNQLNCVTFDSLGNLWVGGSSISKFDGISWNTYLSNKVVSAIAADAHGNVWFGTYGYGLMKFDGSNLTSYNNGSSGFLRINRNAMAIDKQGNVWMGTSNQQIGTGVSMFDGTNWHSYNTDDGLVSRMVLSVAIDEQGNKWFGTDKGVSKFDGVHWTSYTSANTNNILNSAYSIAIDLKGNVWFGTNPDGLIKFDGTNWTKYNHPSNSGTINTVVADKLGNIWIGTEAGISKFDGTNWINYTYNNGSLLNYVSSIAIDSHGNKWMGTANNSVFELQE